MTNEFEWIHRRILHRLFALLDDVLVGANIVALLGLVVLEDMLGQIAFEARRFAAKLADKRFHGCVHRTVLGQVGTEAESLAADFAHKRLVVAFLLLRLAKELMLLLLLMMCLMLL